MQLIRRFSRDLLAITLVLGGLLFFYGGFLTGPSRIGDDTVIEYYPGVNYFAKSVAAGRFPLWFSGVRDGSPFYSDTQLSVFYPPQWILPCFVRDGRLPFLVYQRYIFLHCLLGAFFAYAFLKALRLNPISAAAGALAFCLSSFFALRMAVNFVMIQVYVWLPLQLYFVHRLTAKRDAWSWLGLVMAMALSLLAGHPQTTVYGWYLVVGFWLYRGWSRERDRAHSWASALGRCIRAEALPLVGTFALVFGIAAVMVLPGAENWSRTARPARSFQTVADTSLPYRGLVRLFVPNFFGSLVRQYGVSFWGADPQSATVALINPTKVPADRGFWQYWECAAYSGQIFWVALALALFNWKRIADKRAVGFFLIAWLMALWFMLGRYGGLFSVLYPVVPGVSFFRGPAKMSCVATFTAAVVLAYLVELVRTDGPKLRLWPALLLVAGYGGFWMWLSVGGERLLPELRDWRKLSFAQYETGYAAAAAMCTILAIWVVCRTGQPTRAAGLCAFLVVSIADVRTASNGLGTRIINPDEYFDVESNKPLSDLMQAARQLKRPFRSGQLYEGRLIEEVGWHRNLPYLCDFLEVPEGYTSYYLNSIAQFQSLTNEPAKIAIQNIPLAITLDESQQSVAVTSEDCLPRAKFYSQVRRFDSRTTLLSALNRNEIDWRNEVAVWGSAAANLKTEPIDGSTSKPNDEVEFVGRTPETYTIAYTVGRPGIIFVSQAYYPGWIADGGRVNLVEVFGAFQGLVIPAAGRGEITVRFSPPILKLAASISLISVIIAILAAVLARKGKTPP